MPEGWCCRKGLSMGSSSMRGGRLHSHSSSNGVVSRPSSPQSVKQSPGLAHRKIKCTTARSMSSEQEGQTLLKVGDPQTLRRSRMSDLSIEVDPR